MAWLTYAPVIRLEGLTTVTVTLAEFVLARIAEDEAAARAAQAWGSDEPWMADGGSLVGHSGASLAGYVGDDVAPHIARHAPARVLADCEAKRAVAALHSGDAPWCGWSQGGDMHHSENHDGFGVPEDCDTLRALASPYVEHPEFDPAWRVSSA